MTLYFAKGLTNEALKTYEACKKVLMKELKTHPDATTDAIYNKIFGKIEGSQTAKTKDSNKKSKMRGKR